ncbi:MAG: acetyl-CoA carboxylase biotin carboxylase subunit, partial [Myxococcota bacterium]
VTEILYGVDLVAWQLDVAAGLPLPATQETLDGMRRGAAIECRIYAEDSERFLPSPGTITHLRVPSGPYVRDDSGVYEGAEISPHYDPMLSKLIVWGQDRAQALARMRRALDEYAVRGIRTNLPFHRRILRHDEFCAGRFDTGFIARERERLAELGTDDEARAMGIIAAAIADSRSGAVALASTSADAGRADGGISIWRSGRRGWRGGLG